MATNLQLLVDRASAAQATEDFLRSQTRPLSSVLEATGLIPSHPYLSKKDEKDSPSARDELSKATISDLSRFPDDWLEIEPLPLAAATAPAADTGNYAVSSISLLTSTFRDNVTIATTDTNDNPAISTNWLLANTDQELAVAGVKHARQLAAATGITVGPEVFPGPQVRTDEQILQFILGTVGPIHHASATHVSPSVRSWQT